MAGEDGSPSERSRELKSKADEAFRAQDFQEAVALYTQAATNGTRTPLGAPGLTTRSKEATRNKGHRD